MGVSESLSQEPVHGIATFTVEIHLDMPDSDGGDDAGFDIGLNVSGAGVAHIDSDESI